MLMLPFLELLATLLANVSVGVFVTAPPPKSSNRLVFVGIVKEKIFFLADLCSFRSLPATRFELESDRTLVPLAGACSPGVGDGKVTAASSVVSIFDCDRHRSRCWEDLRFI